MSSNDKILNVTRDEFFEICKNENGSLDGNKMYQVYNAEISQAIKQINILKRELKKYQKKADKFIHSTVTEKQVKSVTKYLKERYTIKEVAEKVGVSTSTVSRIKKEKDITKKKLTPKKKSVE